MSIVSVPEPWLFSEYLEKMRETGDLPGVANPYFPFYTGFLMAGKPLANPGIFPSKGTLDGLILCAKWIEQIAIEITKQRGRLE